MDKKSANSTIFLIEYKKGFSNSCWTPSIHLVVNQHNFFSSRPGAWIMLSKPAPHGGQITSLWGKQQLTTQCRTLYEHFVLGLPSDELRDVTKEEAYSSELSPLWALCVQSTLTLWWTRRCEDMTAYSSVQNPLWALCIQSTLTLWWTWRCAQCSAFMNRLYSVYTYLWWTWRCEEIGSFSLHLPPDELGEESAEESQDEVHDDQSIQLLTQESFPALKSSSTMIISTNSTMVFSHTCLSDYCIKLQCVQLCTQANKMPQITSIWGKKSKQ